MRRTYILTLLTLAFVSMSCERDLDFDTPSEESEGSMIINAVAVTGSPLTVYLNKTYPVGKTPRLTAPTYDQAVFFKDDITTDYVSNVYYDNTAITGARVEATVNGQQTYTLILNEEDKSYVCDYVPTSGDHIEVRAAVEGEELKAETSVPAKPTIEVLSHEVLDQNPYQDRNGLFGGTDTIMRLTCRISDMGGEQYYRLRVRSERVDHYKIVTSFDQEKMEPIYSTLVYYYMQDVYFSEDELFKDIRLTSSMGGWETSFSSVFDNVLMKGGNYTFTIDSPKACNTSGSLRALNTHISSDGPNFEPRVMVELQAISPELYQYMKSVQLYRVTEDDVYSEPVQIYSNAEGGWGIFGALSYDRHFVEYGE